MIFCRCVYACGAEVTVSPTHRMTSNIPAWDFPSVRMAPSREVVSSDTLTRPAGSNGTIWQKMKIFT